MKFESKVGLGEICVYNEGAQKRDRGMLEVLVKVVGITFNASGSHCVCETTSVNFGVQRFTCHESELVGDPYFNQELGSYPPESDGAEKWN